MVLQAGLRVAWSVLLSSSLSSERERCFDQQRQRAVRARPSRMSLQIHFLYQVGIRALSCPASIRHQHPELLSVLTVSRCGPGSASGSDSLPAAPPAGRALARA